MNILLAIILIAGPLIAFYVISTYNFFQTTKQHIKASIQEIGNQLKRQASLIPNLESSAKGFLKQEKDIFKELTSARKTLESNPGDLASMENAASAMTQLLPKLQVVVEDNPELKSNEVVEKLMNELRDTSDKLMYSRRTLIDLVADYNIKLETFPSNLVGKLFGFTHQQGLETPETGAHVEVSESETKDHKVSL